jgi:hypothetical protein
MKQQQRRRSPRARKSARTTIGNKPVFRLALAAYLDAALNMVQAPASAPAAFVTAAQQWEQARDHLITTIDRHGAHRAFQCTPYPQRFGAAYPLLADRLTERRYHRKRL